MIKTKLVFKICFFSILITHFMACESFIGGTINSDSNAITEVPINAQLPAIELTLVDVYGGQFSRLGGMLTQQIEGTARGCVARWQYTGLTPTAFNTSWTIIYTGVLNEIKIAKETAIENEYHHYLGILNTLEAYTLMIATDVWDDMPYSQALNGIDGLNPTYDTQAELYVRIYQLLDEALILLEGSPGSFTPNSDDLIHNGDIENWIKAVHAIKSRGYLHQKNYEKAKSEAIASFQSSEEDLDFQYPDANAAANWYRFVRDRTGDIEFSPVMRNLMLDLNDTFRLSKIDHTFTTTHPYLVADYRETLIGYIEIQFIIAECDMRLNEESTAEGYEAMLNGIRASFGRFGLSDENYESYIAQTDVIPFMEDNEFETIMLQKYIAMFLQPEVYSDWRRTNIPELTPVSGSTVPVRWHYGADELQFNSNAPDVNSVNIFEDRVGWNR